MEALQSAPEQIPTMIQRAMNMGIEADYVLMDTWFTHQPLIKNIRDQGLDVIGMVKKMKQRYLVGDQRVSLDQLYRLALPCDGKKGFYASSIRFKPMEFQLKSYSFATATRKVTGSLF